MVTALLAATFIVLLAGPVAGALRPGLRQHGPASIVARRPGRAAGDCASALDSIARQVRSGASLAAAIVAAADGQAPFDEVAARLAGGSSLSQALAFIEPRDPDVALTVQALSAAAHLGGPIAATLDDAAAVLRERGAARAERRAHGAQARLSARVLTIVPVGFASWGVVASQRTRDVYVSSLAGGVCALCGLALNYAGWRWMRRIIGAP